MSRQRLEHWFSTLAPGDRVRIRFPWNDGETPGGRIEPAVVTHVRPPRKESGMDPHRRVFFRYRTPAGDIVERMLPMHDTYTHVIPLDHKVVYDPRHGYVVARGQPKGGMRR